MIDIHSHILPAVDDGAQTLSDALILLRMAQDDGVTTQFLTPHVRPPRYQNEPEDLHQQFTAFTQAAAAEGLTITLRLSSEVRVGPNLMAVVQNADFPLLGTHQGKKLFLLEMPYSQVPTGTLNIIAWLMQREFIPIIVHPERNREFQSKPALIQEFVEAGCLLQITASSLTGRFGDKAERTAINLIENDRVTFMATDCHNIDYRPPDLHAGYERAKTLVGASRARDLVHTTAARMLACD